MSDVVVDKKCWQPPPLKFCFKLKERVTTKQVEYRLNDLLPALAKKTNRIARRWYESSQSDRGYVHSSHTGPLKDIRQQSVTNAGILLYSGNPFKRNRRHETPITNHSRGAIVTPIKT